MNDSEILGKHLVSELDGQQLDAAVAKALGHRIVVSETYGVEFHDSKTGQLIVRNEYSTNWADGGPIVERMRINLKHNHDDPGQYFEHRWTASFYIRLPQHACHYADGSTPLIAAMRAYAKSKFGEEVELP